METLFEKKIKKIPLFVEEFILKMRKTFDKYVQKKNENLR